MKSLKIIIPVAMALLLAGQAAAQSERELREREEAATRTVEAREAEYARQLEAAERQMEEAARQIAELTSERIPQLRRIERRLEFVASDRPRLGVTIGGDEDGPVEGVSVLAVTPGSAAGEAGLRAGDIITSVDGETLSAADAEQSNSKLLDFMQGVEEGDTLDIEYLRDGKVGTVEVEPRPIGPHVFSFGVPDAPFAIPGVPDVHVVPRVLGNMKNHFVFDWSSAGWGDMELVELNAGLGRYFGTDEGLLVVNAPTSSALQLEDGDVIQKIDGRTPESVRHAMRILGSYQGGESLKLEIMRDKKRRTLDVEVPDDRSSMLFEAPAPVAAPAAVPAPPRPSTPVEKT